MKAKIEETKEEKVIDKEAETTEKTMKTIKEDFTKVLVTSVVITKEVIKVVMKEEIADVAMKENKSLIQEIMPLLMKTLTKNLILTIILVKLTAKIKNAIITLTLDQTLIMSLLT